MDRVAGVRYEVDSTGAKRLVSKIEPPMFEVSPWKVGTIALVHAVVVLLGVAAWTVYRWRRRPARA